MQHHDHTFVHAAPAAVVARLPTHLSLDGAEVDLAPDWHVGSSDGACRTRASWRRGRRRGTGVVEVRPAGWGWSELALSWQGVPAPAQELGAYVEHRTPVQVPVRRRGPVARRAVLAAATTLALVGAAVVVLPLGASTPVTADAALTEFRTLTPTTDAPDRAGAAPPAPAPSPAASGGTDAPPRASGGDQGAGPSPSPSTPEPTAAADRGDAPSTDRSDAAAQPAAPAPSPDRPAAGVYRYATDGWEELDVRGSHRRFPDETALVIHHTECGYRQIWEPLEERRDEHGFCVDTDPAALVTTATARSFFGQEREQDFACAPVTVTDGGWTTRCDDGDGTSMTVTTQQVATERRTVGGEAVEVTKLRVAADLTGETSGERRSTVWTRSSDGLVVRSEVEADLEVPGPFGTVHYRERYELDLVDLAPRT